MKTWRTVVAATLLASAGSSINAAEEPRPRIDVRKILTVDQFTRAGLTKLSADEIEILNEALSQAISIVQPPPTPALRPEAHVSMLDDLALLEGAVIVANDGTFLGKIASKYDSDSIVNEYGDHGGKYSDTSISNDYGEYGGKYSDLSPFNLFSSTPPRIILDGKFVAYLTVNRFLSPRVEPGLLIGYLRSR